MVPIIGRNHQISLLNNSALNHSTIAIQKNVIMKRRYEGIDLGILRDSESKNHRKCFAMQQLQNAAVIRLLNPRQISIQNL